MKVIYKFLGALLVFATLANANVVKNLDSKKTHISMTNGVANVLLFPFVVTKASMATKSPSDYTISTKDRGVVVIPQVADIDKDKTIKTQLIVWDEEGIIYLIDIDLNGRDNYFEFTTSEFKNNDPRASRFETGRIDKDVKRLIYLASNNKKIPGYVKTVIKKDLWTKELMLRKHTIWDGKKYRLELWHIKNLTHSAITLDESNFYTKGILAISFTARTINPSETTAMYIVVNKSDLK
jgi:hypothetical protein